VSSPVLVSRLYPPFPILPQTLFILPMEDLLRTSTPSSSRQDTSTHTPSCLRRSGHLQLQDTAYRAYISIYLIYTTPKRSHSMAWSTTHFLG
jgi:hypothetical protein